MSPVLAAGIPVILIPFFFIAAGVWIAYAGVVRLVSTNRASSTAAMVESAIIGTLGLAGGIALAVYGITSYI